MDFVLKFSLKSEVLYLFSYIVNFLDVKLNLVVKQKNDELFVDFNCLFYMINNLIEVLCELNDGNFFFIVCNVLIFFINLEINEFDMKYFKKIEM